MFWTPARRAAGVAGRGCERVCGARPHAGAHVLRRACIVSGGAQAAAGWPAAGSARAGGQRTVCNQEARDGNGADAELLAGSEQGVDEDGDERAVQAKHRGHACTRDGWGRGARGALARHTQAARGPPGRPPGQRRKERGTIRGRQAGNCMTRAICACVEPVPAQASRGRPHLPGPRSSCPGGRP